MNRIFTHASVAALAVAMSSAAAAQAQTTGANLPAPAARANTNSGELGDIVVTAQKRSESLQKVPLAVTVVTAAELDRSGIRDLQGIVSSVPNLNLGAQLGMAKIALRGIGLENISSGAEGSIAFHIDGVFVSRSIAALASFYDVQQVEVLRGPQGTLYGRNATGGAINITTREPTQELSGYFNLTGGNYARVTAEGAVSGAIVPGVLAARIAFQTQNHDGYGKNIVTGNGIDDLNSRAIRGSLRFTPTDKLTIDVKADYFRERDHAGGYHTTGPAGFAAPGVSIIPYGLAAGGTVASNLRDISNEDDPKNSADFWGVSGKISYDLGNGIRLSSLTAYRSTKNDTRTDLDSTNLPLVKQVQFERSKQFSEELQLSGKSDKLTWLLGFFYFHEKDNGTQADPFNPSLTLLFSPPTTLSPVLIPNPFLPNFLTTGYLGSGFIKTSAIAVFGQASYEIVDDFHLTLGVRYSSEKKVDHDEFAFDIFTPYVGNLASPQFTRDDSKRFNSFTPRVALDYQVTPDTLLYASWSRGFKSGTYSLGSLTPPVDPETVSAFEGGIKSQLFDRHLRLNLAGFYYDYKNLQIGKVTGTSSATLVLENAASAKIYGLEAELKAQISPSFDIDANAAWLHARFADYCSADPARPFLPIIPSANCAAGEIDLKGNTLSQSPNFTFFVGAQYHVPTDLGTFTLRGEVAWRDRVYFTPFNLSYLSQAPNTRLNAFLNWTAKDDHWTGSLFVKNLTNKTVVGNILVSSSLVGFPTNGYLEDPRTYGLRLGYKF